MSVVLLYGSNVVKAATEAGLVRIWETRQACAKAATSAGVDEWRAKEREVYARELAELGEEQANERGYERQSLKRLGETFGTGRTPLWRVMSGLMPGMEVEHLHPNDRAGRLTRLIRSVERVVRYEWRAFEKVTRERASGNVEMKTTEGAEAPDDPRVRWWDPMRVVCEHFGIAYSMLSRLARETAGLSASDLTDRVKAELVRTRMRDDVKAWVLEIRNEENAKEESKLKGASAEDAIEFMWSRVAEKRGRGRWSRSAWAVKFGYSSYTRFQRACLAEYGVTPVELERAVLEEVMGERAEVEGPRADVAGEESTSDCADEVAGAEAGEKSG